MRSNLFEEQVRRQLEHDIEHVRACQSDQVLVRRQVKVFGETGDSVWA